MADDEDRKQPKSNTDRPYKPSDQKSRPEPLPRGQVASPAPHRGPSPSPGGGGRMGGSPPRNPGPPGPPGRPEPGRGQGPSKGPVQPAKDFNAAAERNRSTEFNIKARGKEPGRDDPDKGRSR